MAYLVDPNLLPKLFLAHETCRSELAIKTRKDAPHKLPNLQLLTMASVANPNISTNPALVAVP